MTATAIESKRVKTVTRKLVPLKRLKSAAHNPPNRTLLKNLKELVDSLDMIGLLHPVTITPDYEIIDGHRRVAAAKHLGWLDIECSIIEEDAASIYASVNVSARRMSGNDALTVWLANPHAVPSNTASRFAEMERTLCKSRVRAIAKAGYSYRVFELARRVARYCEQADNETIQAITEWLLNTAAIGQVRKALEAGESPRTILEAVRKGKPIVFRLQIAE